MNKAQRLTASISHSRLAVIKTKNCKPTFRQAGLLVRTPTRGRESPLDDAVKELMENVKNNKKLPNNI